MGLSGSGKTTLAKIIYNKLKKKKIVHVDGDQIREMHGSDLGYTIKDRLINAGRISRLVKFLNNQNVSVVVSVLSNFPNWLKWNRKNIKDYFEIYLKTDLLILKKRKRDLYSGKIKNVVGVNIKFNEPRNPEMIIKNCNSLKRLDIIAEKIIKKLNIN
jgi:adenylylsulfate kinase